MFYHATNEQEREALLQKIPVGRFGTPEEIAQLALFLASNAAGYITGETIVASGGYR
jgi:3-oxoacyl-[acyl-carrier protein] reductase